MADDKEESTKTGLFESDLLFQLAKAAAAIALFFWFAQYF